MSDIESLSARALADIAAAQDPEALDALRVALGEPGATACVDWLRAPA